MVYILKNIISVEKWRFKNDISAAFDAVYYYKNLKQWYANPLLNITYQNFNCSRKGQILKFYIIPMNFKFFVEITECKKNMHIKGRIFDIILGEMQWKFIKQGDYTDITHIIEIKGKNRFWHWFYLIMVKPGHFISSKIAKHKLHDLIH